MKGNTFILFSITAVVAIWLGGCSKSSSSSSANDISSALSSLAQLPSADGMLTGTGANSTSITKSYKTERLDNQFLSGINLQSVSGTPPKLNSISSTTADTYFWGGLIADINANWTGKTNDQKNAIRNQFWGQDTTTPGPGGQGSCMMAQSVAESLSRIGESAGTMCYMKGITTNTDVVVTGATAATAFTQGATDKLVKVAVTNMPAGHRGRAAGNMNVFFKIKGTNTVTADVYAYDMWMCQDGTISSKESLTVTKSTGEMTSTMNDSRTEGRGTNTGSMSITMNLKKDASDNIVIDPAKDRTAVSKFKGTWGTFASKVTLTPKDYIYGWRYNSSSWGTDYNFSLAAFTGTTAETFAFLQGAFKGYSKMDGQTAHTYKGITEFRDTKYVAVSSSDLSTDATYAGMSEDTMNTTDSFFKEASTAPTFSSTGLSCTDTPDVSIAMDFSVTSIGAIRTKCDGDKHFSNYEMCNSTTLQSAMNKLWQ